MKIVANGLAEAGIYLPDKPTPREMLAAQELQYYIRKMTGASLPFGARTNRIVIGGPSRNRFAAQWVNPERFASTVPGPEGIMIRTFPSGLLLAGSDDSFERGTLYAVYEFLERFLGISLAAYSAPGLDAGEWIPKTETIEIGQIDYTKPCADIAYRTAIVQYANTTRSATHGLNPSFISWLAKNRYNRILTMGSVYESYKQNGMLEEAEKRGIRFTVGHHESSQMFLPAEKYYERHPEYFRLMPDGSRFRPDGLGGQLVYCMRNEEAIAETANNICLYLEENPTVDIIALWPNDGIHEQCCCSKCSPHSKSENYVHYMNRIAEEVGKRHPEVMLDMLVYFDLWDYPGGKVAHNLLADVSTWHTNGLRSVGKPDGTGLIGTRAEDALLSWKNAGMRCVYYDYFMGVFPSRQRYMPMADEIQSLCHRFAEKGVWGAGTQIEPFNLWNNLFNFYTYGRTAYDSSLDMKLNLSSFTRIFGEAAPYMEKLILYAEQILDGQETIATAGRYLIEHMDLKLVYDLFDEAFDAARSPRARNNLRLMRMEIRYTHLECLEDDSRDFIDYPNIKTIRDETGELEYMSMHFDSYTRNDPGVAIDIPIKGSQENGFVPDRWLQFE